MGDLIDGQFVRVPCQFCGHSPDVHSFKEEENRGLDVTSAGAKYSCNGGPYYKCDLNCKIFVGSAIVPDLPCPVCSTKEWAYWDSHTNTGKCARKHLIATDVDGKLYCCATSN